MSLKKSILRMSVLLMAMTVLLFPGSVSAATLVVTPANEQGWSTDPPLADNRPGGAVNFVVDFTAPAGTGALQLTTDATTTAKAQYMHAAGVPLSQVNELSYYTKQITPAGPVADPAYQLVMCLLGAPNATTCNGFTTLVYEPYQNPSQGAIVNNTWQQWDVDQGMFWSTRSVTCPNGPVAGAPGGPASYTLAQIKTMCPDAIVAAYGVNIGTNNPGYDVETDLFNFNGTIYNFEARPQSRADCKNGGWAEFDNPSFRNQGDCVSYVQRGNRGNRNTVRNRNNVTINNNVNQSAGSGNVKNNKNTNGGSARSGNTSNSNTNNNNVNISN